MAMAWQPPPPAALRDWARGERGGRPERVDLVRLRRVRVTGFVLRWLGVGASPSMGFVSSLQWWPALLGRRIGMCTVVLAAHSITHLTGALDARQGLTEPCSDAARPDGDGLPLGGTHRTDTQLLRGRLRSTELISAYRTSCTQALMTASQNDLFARRTIETWKQCGRTSLVRGYNNEGGHAIDQ